MYHLATLHPKLNVINEEYREGFLTRKDKERVILDFYRRGKKIPLCIDHCDQDDPNFTVPLHERMGHVLDLFINQEGSMMTKVKLDDTHPTYKKIKQSMHLAQENWGVSVWIQISMDLKTGNIVKELAHIALTTFPLFAEHNTFFHSYSETESDIDREITKKYYKENVGESFASKELKRKLLGKKF